jgi:hypothetical protein
VYYNRRLTDMKYIVTAFLLVVAAPVMAQDDFLYKLDIERMLEVAIDALVEQHPDIDPEDLLINGGVGVNCFPTGGKSKSSVEAFRAENCSGSISFSRHRH